MKSNYKKLGDYIRPLDERNSDLAITNLQGVSITKEFVPSIANIIGTDLSTYKIVRTGQFAYGPVTSRNGDKVSIALLKGEDCIISSSYSPFEVYKTNDLLPEYLMLWFMRPEFDRYARFMSNGSAREVFDWDCMCNVELPIPPFCEQNKIVQDYQIITKRIELLQKINDNLVSQSEALFKELVSEQTANGKFGDIADVSSGKRPENMSSGDIPLLGAGGVMDYIADYNYCKPSLIIGRVGTHGVVQRCNKFWASDNTLVINPKYYEFVFHILRNIDYNALNRGSTQPLITQGDIKALDIYIPKIDKLKKFEDNTSIIMNYFSQYQNEIDLLNKIIALIVSKVQ